MKTWASWAIIIGTIALLPLIGCGRSTPAVPTEEPLGVELEYSVIMVYTGEVGQNITTSNYNKPHPGSVEISIVAEDNDLRVWVDPAYNGQFLTSTIRSNISDDCGFQNRFSCVIKWNGFYYSTGSRSANSDVYLYKSSDGINWAAINNGNPIIKKSKDPNSIWYNIWNCGFDFDENGKCYMLVECAPDCQNQVLVGLGLATGSLENDRLPLVLSDSFQIHHAGNPYLKYIGGRGLIALYGSIYTSPSDAYWKIKVAYSTDLNTFIQSDKISIWAGGVHVCDPHAEEYEGKLLIAFSHDQNKYIISEIDSYSFISLFDDLRVTSAGFERFIAMSKDEPL